MSIENCNGPHDQLEELRRQANMMAPAHAYMQQQSREKIARVCKKLAKKPKDPSVCVSLARIQQAKMPVPIPVAEPGMVKVATAGMSLLGAPEIFLVWPEEHGEAASGILQDVVLSAMNGDAALKLAVGRRVFAARFGLGYTIRAAPECDDSPLFSFLQTHTKRKTGVPFAVELAFELAVRDGMDLPGIKGCVALWRPKGGVDVFTGVVQTPVPSPHWMAAGFDCGFARLVEGNDDIEGPIRMLTTGEMMEAMTGFD